MAVLCDVETDLGLRSSAVASAWPHIQSNVKRSKFEVSSACGRSSWQQEELRVPQHWWSIRSMLSRYCCSSHFACGIRSFIVYPRVQKTLTALVLSADTHASASSQWLQAHKSTNFATSAGVSAWHPISATKQACYTCCTSCIADVVYCPAVNGR